MAYVSFFLCRGPCFVLAKILFKTSSYLTFYSASSLILGAALLKFVTKKPSSSSFYNTYRTSLSSNKVRQEFMVFGAICLMGRTCFKGS